MGRQEKVGETGKNLNKTSPWDKLKEVVFRGERSVETKQATPELERKESTPEEEIGRDIEKELGDIREQIFEKEKKLNGLHESFEREGKVIGYRESGGDAYAMQVGRDEKGHEEAYELGKEIAKLNERQSFLSDPEARKAEINRRIEEKKEAEERRSAFDAAMLSGWNRQYGFQAKLEQYDKRIFDLEGEGKKEEADKIRVQKQEYIDEKIIPVGQMILEKMKEKKSEGDSSTEDGTVDTDGEGEEQAKIIESKNEAKEKTKCERYRERAISFAREITIEEAKGILTSDQFMLSSLEARSKKELENAGKTGKEREKRKYLKAHEETEKEVIEKFGDYGSSWRKDANGVGKDAVYYGRRRAVDWSIVNHWLSSDDKRKARKALEEKGYSYKEFPDTWNDRRFSAKQMADMREVVEQRLTDGFKGEDIVPHYGKAMVDEEAIGAIEADRRH